LHNIINIIIIIHSELKLQPLSLAYFF